MAFDSHFTHSHFNSNNHTQQNSHHHHHHHHHLSLSSNSTSSQSAISLTSSPSSSPSVSVSPTFMTLRTPPQSTAGSIVPSGGFHHQATNNSNGNHQQYQNSSNNSNNSGNNYSNKNNISHQQHQSIMQQQQLQNSLQQNTSRYKTELCRPFEENGTCKYGEKCQFAHGLSELRTLTRHPKYKTEFCRTFHTTGFCPYGPRCHFIHNSKTTSASQSSTINLGSYSNIPFGHQTSHSASPSTSPISSTSSATTTHGSLSSSASTTSSSSPPSSSRLLDDMSAVTVGYQRNHNQYSTQTIRASRKSEILDEDTHEPVIGGTSVQAKSVAAAFKKNESDEVACSAGCVSETQRLFWLHSHMNEGSRWPPAICASGLISNNSGSSRRTWQQMQA